MLVALRTFPLVALALLVALAAGFAAQPVPAQAQTPRLTAADFDDTGLTVDTVSYTVTISQANGPPEFSGATATRTIAEDAADSANVGAAVTATDLNEVTDLGVVVFIVGHRGSNYGYVSGSYGRARGDFPEEVYDSGSDRTVKEIYEDDDGYWYLRYSGGTANDWLSDDEELKTILVTVTYEGEVDTREFVLGGFIEEYLTSNRLKLDPPLPDRDWDDKDGQEISITFRRHWSEAAPHKTPGRLTDPKAGAATLVEFLLDTTPGGGVVFQSLLTIFVFSGYVMVAHTRKKRQEPWEMLLAGIVLCLTPWIPAIWGVGDPIAGVIIGANVANGAYVYKAFLARTEG